MGAILKFLYIMIFATLLGAGAYLLFYDIPAPQNLITKEIKLGS